MSIWFYLFLIALGLSAILWIKSIIFKQEVKNIGKSYKNILESDTNNLITVNTNNKELKKLANILNNSLKELRKLELEFKHGNQELKSSITNISHDLRTPLTAIKVYLDLIHNNLNNSQKEYFKIIDNRVQDLIELTEQLFDFAKSIEIHHEIKKENICINDVLEESLANFYSVFKEYNINPQINICQEKVIKSLNENMLKRIFENIISNAIKYGKNDFIIKMYSNGTIEFTNQTDYLDITTLEKIFDRYYTVKNVKKANGIGLSIAKQLVDLNNGKIEAKYKNDNLTIKLKF